jgi:ADP-heptose:LPS heptosyltransferase
MSLNSNGIFDPTGKRHDIAFASKIEAPIFSPGQLDTWQAKKQLALIDNLLEGKPPKFLISRASGGIGDVLMTFPTVTALKERYGAHITYATNFSYLNKALKAVAEHCPDIDKVIDCSSMDVSDYHAHINLYCPCISNAVPIHRIDLFAEHANLRDIKRDINYKTTHTEKVWADNYFSARNIDPNKTVLVQPCASNVRRSYDVLKLKQALLSFLKERPDYTVMVIQHDSDFEKSVSWNHPGFHKLENFAITEIAAITEIVRLVVCQDSALLHVAGMFSKLCIGLFGPTDYRARFYNNMYPMCPGEALMCWPSWYSSQFDAKMFWNMLSPESIASYMIEHTSSQEELLTRKISFTSI